MDRAEVLAKWDKMTPRERDAWVHEKIFNKHVQWCTAGDGSKYSLCVPNYSTGIVAAFEVEEKIKELNADAKYVFWLTEIAGVQYLPNRYETIFAMVHATPEQRCKAALLAIEIK